MTAPLAGVHPLLMGNSCIASGVGSLDQVMLGMQDLLADVAAIFQ